MSNRCHFCNRELGPLEPTYHFVVTGQPEERMVTHAIWADTSLGGIGVCNICYEQESFGSLTPEEIGVLHYMFSHPCSEDAEDYRVSLERLQRAFALKAPQPRNRAGLRRVAHRPCGPTRWDVR